MPPIIQKMPSWLKLLRALHMTHSIDALLPESISSPMAEVKAQRKKASVSPSGKTAWGDES